MIQRNIKTPAKILERLALDAYMSRSLFSEREHQKRRKNNPDAYKPGFAYYLLTSTEDQEILKNLKSEDLQNIPRFILGV